MVIDGTSNIVMDDQKGGQTVIQLFFAWGHRYEALIADKWTPYISIRQPSERVLGKT